MKGGKTLSTLGKILGSSALGMASFFIKTVNENAKKTGELIEETNEKRKSLFKKAGLIFGSAALGFSSLYFKIISDSAKQAGNQKTAKKTQPKSTAKKTTAKKTTAPKSQSNTQKSS